MLQRSAVPGSFLSARQRFFLNASRLASFLLLILLLAAPSSVAAQAAGTDQQGLTNESILKMLRGGLGEEVILTSVEHQPGKYSLGVDEMIALRDAGVSDKVIQAMLRKAAAPPPPAATPLVLADGTLVNLRLRKSLSSATAAQGQTVELEVTRELKIGDVVVAPVGAIAEGVVSEARTAKRGNIGGKLEVSLRRLRLVDGTEASLRTIPQSQSAVKKAAKTAGNIGKAVTFMGLKPMSTDRSPWAAPVFWPPPVLPRPLLQLRPPPLLQLRPPQLLLPPPLNRHTPPPRRSRRSSSPNSRRSGPLPRARNTTSST